MSSLSIAHEAALRVIQSVVGQAQQVRPDAALIGESGLVDSMKLVEICLALEDESQGLGFSFDWTSDSAMSAARSVFRTAASLADEFARQWQAASPRA